MELYADLHTHTICSDGNLSPDQLLQKASKAGLAAISFTDHDSVEGCIEAYDLCKKYNIEFITGIEFSCYEDSKEYHILGYHFDPDNSSLKTHIEEFRNARFKRAEKILDKLNKLRIPISFDQILAKSKEAPIARPHIASALMDLGITSNLKEAFNLYLAEGRPAYEMKKNFPIEKAVKLINQAGGIAVLAHPAKMVTQDALYRMIQVGLDGIEVVHPMHDESTQNYYRGIASQYWLLGTGGSDYHGTRDYDDDNFGRFVVPYSVVESIKFHANR